MVEKLIALQYERDEAVKKAIDENPKLKQLQLDLENAEFKAQELELQL